MPKHSATFTWAPRRWRDLSEDDATQAVLNGESIFVRGIAGVGKTHYVLGLVQQLKALGKKLISLQRRILPHPVLGVAQPTTMYDDAFSTERALQILSGLRKYLR